MNTTKLFFILLTLSGLAACNPDDVKNTYTISGKVGSVYFFTDPLGEIDSLQFTVDLISNDKIIASSDNGVFTFSGLEEGKSYVVKPESFATGRNGMSALDFVIIRKYIEGNEVLDAFQKLAADVNQDNLIDSTDLVLFQNCLLDNSQCFNWRFATDDYDGNGKGQADQYLINNLMSDVIVHLIPINTGDVTGTHIPH